MRVNIQGGLAILESGISRESEGRFALGEIIGMFSSLLPGNG